MAMVSVVNWLPTSGLMVQADRLGPKVGGHLAPCCTHRVNQGELSQYCFQHDDSTIKIVLVLLLLLLLLGNGYTERQSARMSKITNNCLARSVTGCFIAVPIWQQWASKG